MCWAVQKRQFFREFLVVRIFFTPTLPTLSHSKESCVYWLSERTSISVHSIHESNCFRNFFFPSFFSAYDFHRNAKLGKKRFPQFLFLLFWHSQLTACWGQILLKEKRSSKKNLSHIFYSNQNDQLFTGRVKFMLMPHNEFGGELYLTYHFCVASALSTLWAMPFFLHINFHNELFVTLVLSSVVFKPTRLQG